MLLNALDNVVFIASTTIALGSTAAVLYGVCWVVRAGVRAVCNND